MNRIVSNVVAENLNTYLSRWTALLMDMILQRQAAARRDDREAWEAARDNVIAVEAIIDHQQSLAMGQVRDAGRR